MNVTELEGLVRTDLAPFADPESQIVSAATDTVVTLQWDQANRCRSASFRLDESHEIIVTEDGVDSPYRAFFAGSTMADLDALAAGTARLYRPKDDYVEGTAHVAGRNTDGPTLDVLSGAVDSSDGADATRMVFLRADAGVGKTTSLRQLCHRSAQRRLERRSSTVLLFIDAQGRGLRRLDEAIAVALDDLRHPLTYHAVPTLTRLGLIVPVIDGFDELIGASGTFDAAFDSLISFVERLDGQGVFLASARSAYYEREFVARVAEGEVLRRVGWEEVGVELQPWTDDEVEEYVAHHEQEFNDTGRTLPEALAAIDGLFGGPNTALRGKPFFVSRAVDLLIADGEGPAGDTGLLETLVRLYLRRESEMKLLSPETGEPIASPEAIADLLAEVASVMWTLETRELEADDVEGLAELYAELWELAPGEARMLREKSTSLAFLTRSNLQRVGFEHPLFFGFFLASRFPDVLEDDGQSAGKLAVMLGRSALPEGAGPAVAQALLGARTDEDRFKVRVTRALELMSAAAEHPTADAGRTRENAGHLASGMLRYASETGGVPNGLAIANLALAGDDLSGIRASQLRITDVEFRRVDLRGVELAGEAIGAVSFTDCTFDTKSRIELGGTRAILISATYDGRELHSRTALDELGSRLGLAGYVSTAATPSVWRVSSSAHEMVDRLARHYQRSNLLFSDDEFAKRIVGEDLGLDILAVLAEHGVVSTETRAKSGPAALVYRLQAQSIDLSRSLDGPTESEASLAAAWQDLERRFPPE